MLFFQPSHSTTSKPMTASSILGPYALRRSVNKFSSSALGKINKFLLRSFIRQFAGSSSVKFLFHLCARQNKQVSFTLAYASAPAHATDDSSLVSVQPIDWCSKKIRMRNAVALSQWISLAH